MLLKRIGLCHFQARQTEERTHPFAKPAKGAEPPSESPVHAVMLDRR